MNKNQNNMREFFFQTVSHDLSNVLTLPAINKQTGEKTLVLALMRDGDQCSPFGVMFTEEENPFALFEIEGLTETMTIYPEEIKKPFWKFWRNK